MVSVASLPLHKLQTLHHPPALQMPIFINFTCFRAPVERIGNAAGLALP